LRVCVCMCVYLALLLLFSHLSGIVMLCFLCCLFVSPFYIHAYTIRVGALTCIGSLGFSVSWLTSAITRIGWSMTLFNNETNYRRWQSVWALHILHVANFYWHHVIYVTLHFPEW
jgi:hypothetical protein